MISGSIPAKFRGIPRNFAEFRRNLAEITSEVKKFRGIPCWRNSVDTLIVGLHFSVSDCDIPIVSAEVHPTVTNFLFVNTCFC